MSNRMPWFKLYSEIIYDPKIKRLSVHERWLWIVLLSLASSNDSCDDRHTVCVTRAIAYEKRELAELCGFTYVDEINEDINLNELIDTALSKMKKLEMIDLDDRGFIFIKNFKKRQDSYLDDAERAKRYRDKKQVTKVTQPHVTSVTLDKEEEEDKELITPLPPKRGGNRCADLLFEKFWKAYPKRVSRGQAEKTWRKLSPNEQLVDTILQAIERVKTSEMWRKDGGQFIPYPATWLNAKGWEDEIANVAHNSFDDWLAKSEKKEKANGTG